MCDRKGGDWVTTTQVREIMPCMNGEGMLGSDLLAVRGGWLVFGKISSKFDTAPPSFHVRPIGASDICRIFHSYRQYNSKSSG